MDGICVISQYHKPPRSTMADNLKADQNGTIWAVAPPSIIIVNEDSEEVGLKEGAIEDSTWQPTEDTEPMHLQLGMEDGNK